MLSYKKGTRDSILKYYDKNGKDATIKLCRNMLLSSKHKDNKVFHTHVHGEICETVLEVLILDYMRCNQEQTKDWIMKKGLILKDPCADNRYYTELDITVFTPEMIYAFECKSYGGDKKIKDVCKIQKSSGGGYDVFKQHYRHLQVLHSNIGAFKRCNSNEKVSQLILFDFSTGVTEDVRKLKNKLLIPCLSENNVTNIFNLSKTKRQVWDMEYVRKAIDIITTKDNSKNHLEYVRGVRDGKNGK